MILEERDLGAPIRTTVGCWRNGWYGFAVDDLDRMVSLIPADDDASAWTRIGRLHPAAAAAGAGGPFLHHGMDLPHEPAGLRVAAFGTPVETATWRRLLAIAPGWTRTYGEIAGEVSAELGIAVDGRQVGAACAANQIAIVVPCHRVVRTDGRPSGYRWGADRKVASSCRRPRAGARGKAGWKPRGRGSGPQGGDRGRIAT